MWQRNKRALKEGNFNKYLWLKCRQGKCTLSFKQSCQLSILSACCEPLWAFMILTELPFPKVLAHSSLQYCFSSLRFFGIALGTDLFRSHHSNSGELIILFFGHSDVDLLFCFGSLPCYMILLWGFSCQTDGLTCASRILWYSEEDYIGFSPNMLLGETSESMLKFITA